MKIKFTLIAAILMISTVVPSISAESMPSWIKNNAGWWADGTISDKEFVSAIQYLIQTGIISVPQSSDTPTQKMESSDSELTSLQSELDKCQEIKRAYERLDCEKLVKNKMDIYEYKKSSTPITIGPVTFYYPGLGTEGNEFQISESGQAILSIRMLAINTGSDDNVAMMCTGPSICAYDIWNGQKAFKYSGMDFTNGQIVLKPGEAKIFNMLFGPNIGYGGTTFEYDDSKDYFFRVSDSWGSGQIPLNLP